MKKVYVDEILKTGRDLNEPGPGSYPLSPRFSDKNHRGSLYSFRAKNDPMVPHLQKAAKLPGPGSYVESVDTVGKAQLNSKLVNSPSNAFSKAQDRFRTTADRNPASGHYSPR